MLIIHEHPGCESIPLDIDYKKPFFRSCFEMII